MRRADGGGKFPSPNFAKHPEGDVLPFGEGLGLAEAASGRRQLFRSHGAPKTYFVICAIRPGKSCAETISLGVPLAACVVV